MKKHFQTLGALSFALIAVTTAGAAVQTYMSDEVPSRISRILIPYIGNETRLTGQVSQQDDSNVFPDTVMLESADSIILKGDTVKNYHNTFICNADSESISTDAQLATSVPFWIYEYSGDEERDAVTGAIKASTQTGKFYFSNLEPHIGFTPLNTEPLSAFSAGNLYYLMSAADIKFTCAKGLESIVPPPPPPPAVCGDGIIEGTETCDDGNTAARDGCSAECTTELGFSCTSEPSQCSILIPTLGAPSTVHTVCENQQCVQKSGAGGDECQSNSDCIVQCPPCAPPMPGCEGKGTGACGCGPYLNDDGSVCTGGSTAKATVTVKQNGSSNTATENQKDISLLRFEAHASDVDLLLTSTLFSAKDGNLLNAQNYTLWVDTDSNGKVDSILEKGVHAIASRIRFDNLAGGGYPLPLEKTVIFEVHADVASSLTSSTLQLQFAEGIPLVMERLSDGSPLFGVAKNSNCPIGNCDIALNETPSIVWSFGTTGSLFVTKDSTPLRNHQILAGALGEAVLRLQFHAEDEDIDVTHLQLSVSGNATSIDRLEFYRSGESTKFAEATVGGCGSDNTPGGPTFCANMENQQLVIPSGANIDVIVRPRIKTDSQGAVSGDTFSVFVNNSGFPDFTGTVRARGLSSKNKLPINNGNEIDEGEIFIGTNVSGGNKNIEGEINTVVMSKITSITNANPDANGVAIPTGKSSIGQFKFTAAQNSNTKNGINDAIISSLIFNIDATNVGLAAQSFSLFNKADATIAHTCQPHYVSGDLFTAANISNKFYVECKDLTASLMNTEIDSGADATFVLSATITNPKLSSVASSTLEVSLTNFSNYNTSYGFGASHIQWIDKDNGTETIFDWIEHPETIVKSTTYSS